MWGEIEVPSLQTKIEFLNYSHQQHHEEVKNVMRKSFFQYETVCVGSKINVNEKAQRELEKLCDDALVRSNVSLVARDVKSEKIVGVAINVIQSKSSSSNDEQSYFEKFRDNHCQTESAKSLMNYMIEADSRVDVFQKFNVNSLLEIMFLSVFQEYGRHIGYQLCKYSLDVARQHDLKLVCSLFTGKNTQIIGQKLSFDVINQESFNNYSFDGKTFAERNGDNNLVYHLAAKIINDN